MTRNPLITEFLAPYYVYLLVDPATDDIFYVGKGTEWRFADHLEERIGDDEDASEEELTARHARIAEIQARGQEPRVEFARRQIQDERQAYLVEAALIDVLRRRGSSALINQVRGHGSDLGLLTLEELREQVETSPLDTPTPAILLRLVRWKDEVDDELPRAGYGFKRGMSETELYDSARAWWRLDLSRARSVRYAVAVFQGVTRAVWEIDHDKWRRNEGSGSHRGKLAFEGRRVRSHEEPHSVFIGEHGRKAPAERDDGRSLFSREGGFAYWP